MKKDQRARILANALEGVKGANVGLNKSIGSRFDADVLANSMTRLIRDKALAMTDAENSNGNGETIKLQDYDGRVVDRIYLPGRGKKKYIGMWGFGRPQLKTMIAETGLPAARFCEVQQAGKTNYWYCSDWTLLDAYLTKRYGK